MQPKEYLESLFSLEGHVGIITGASRGLGMGIAKVLTDAGATVYNLDVLPRSEEQEITGKMVDVKVNLQDREACREVVDQIARGEGQLDFLINNAGITHRQSADDFNTERYKRIQDINLETLFELSRIAKPYLTKSRYIGRIVSISSMAAYLGFTNVVPYCMTKSGVVGMTRGLAVEWRNENILVNSVAPGWFITKLIEQMYREDPRREEAALGKIALGRFGCPQDIGHMMLFLLSGASTYITGQDFAVDGGALAYGF